LFLFAVVITFCIVQHRSHVHAKLFKIKEFDLRNSMFINDQPTSHYLLNYISRLDKSCWSWLQISIESLTVLVVGGVRRLTVLKEDAEMWVQLQ